MPKNKKPAGGRAAKNFEPRYGAKTSFQDRKRRPEGAAADKPGSKSPGHRGYRAPRPTPPPRSVAGARRIASVATRLMASAARPAVMTVTPAPNGMPPPGPR